MCLYISVPVDVYMPALVHLRVCVRLSLSLSLRVCVRVCVCVCVCVLNKYSTGTGLHDNYYSKLIKKIYI